MSATSRAAAAAAYLLSLPGALAVLLLWRDDRFAAFHARQSLAICGGLVAAPLAWAAAGWLLAWVSLVGPMLAVVLFTLVLAAYVWLAAAWAAGIFFALRGQYRALPLATMWARLTLVRRAPDAGASAGRAERTQPSDA